MTDIPQTPQDRPLVTFALFAYNQEEYIREAVEGAFSQTYEPLEIILSDDCSCDRTFEIMQEMAAVYEGPHLVRARQSKVNKGTLSHVLSVAHEARGKYFAVAAGDDISLPNRVDLVIQPFEDDDVCALSTLANVFVKNPDAETPKVFRFEETRYEHLLEININKIQGATAVYRRDSMPKYNPNAPRILTEDFFLELWFAVLSKKVIYIKNPTVYYRLHQGNVSTTFGARSFKELKNREIKIFASKTEYKKSYLLLRDIIDQIHTYSLIKNKSDILKSIEERVKYFETRSNWYAMSWADRVKFLPDFVKNDGYKIVLPRTFGLQAYTLLARLKLLVSSDV